MKFHSSFHLLPNARHTPILPHYRPDWISISKPDYNCAQVLFDQPPMLHPGDTTEVILEPLRPEFWQEVKVEDILSAMEGLKKVGEATVLEIIK